MGTLKEKLQYLSNSVDDIQDAIIEKGVEVDETIPLGEYGNKIREITSILNNNLIKLSDDIIIVDNSISTFEYNFEKEDNSLTWRANNSQTTPSSGSSSTSADLYILLFVNKTCELNIDYDITLRKNDSFYIYLDVNTKIIDKTTTSSSTSYTSSISTLLTPGGHLLRPFFKNGGYGGSYSGTCSFTISENTITE